MEEFETFLAYEKEVAESKLKIIDRFQKGMKERPVKRTSMVDLVEQILRNVGRPMHISEIIEIAARDYDSTLDRDSVVSFIIKRMNAGRTFVRTAPNTFGLKEWPLVVFQQRTIGKEGQAMIGEVSVILMGFRDCFVTVWQTHLGSCFKIE